MLQNNSAIKSLIDKLWNNFWSGGISNPLTAIEQITYLIFMKRLDDLEAKRERDADFTGEKYVSRFSGKFKVPGSSDEIDKSQLRWSNFKHLPADEMLLHVQIKVFPFLKELQEENQENHINQKNHSSDNFFTRHMANAVFIMPKASLLVEAMNIIEQLFIEIGKDATDGGQAFQDIQGDVYEMLLSEIASAGKNGQFRTPRHIIKLMAELVAPKLGQRMADPSSGTGGFILGFYQYILSDIVRKTDPSKLVKDEDGFERATMSAFLTEDVKQILEQSMYGFDIDTTMVRLGLMNLMMHGIDEPRIDYKDTLSKNYNEDNCYDIVMANPPFTGNIDSGDKNPSLTVDTNKTELLFISRFYNMLKNGGTAAVIVPQGVLFGSGKAFVAARKILIEQSELKAVITMPGGVFKPYAGVATAILIFTKAGETRNVWFYEMQNDGYSLDDKRNKIDKSDLQEIVQQYKNRQKQENCQNQDLQDYRTKRIKKEDDKDDKIIGQNSASCKSPNPVNPDSDKGNDSASCKSPNPVNPDSDKGNDSASCKSPNPVNPDSGRGGKYFFVTKKEIVDNDYDLSFSKYKEEVYEEVKYEKPEVILEKLDNIETGIVARMNELKKML